MTYSPQRDLIGYANDLPQVQWPHTKNGSSAKVALQIVVNYEEGGEHCLLNGDEKGGSVIEEVTSLINARKTYGTHDSLVVGEWCDPMPTAALIHYLFEP